MTFAEFWDAVSQVFSATDVIRLSLLVIILLLTGFLMPSYGSILNATALALLAFAGALYIRGLVDGGQDAVALARDNWNSFLALDGKTLFVYALSFAVVISAVFFLRNTMSRG
ncbi:MAG: hypothetical protein ACT4OG_08995 [Alphaproteobacteria bacterium]